MRGASAVALQNLHTPIRRMIRARKRLAAALRFSNAEGPHGVWIRKKATDDAPHRLAARASWVAIGTTVAKSLPARVHIGPISFDRTVHFRNNATNTQ